MVDERAGDDLGRTGAAAVDEDDEGQVRMRGDPGHTVLVLLLVEAVGPADDAVVDEDGGNVDGLGEKTAWVVAQVDDRPGHALLDELGGGLLEPLGRPGREREDTDVGELASLGREQAGGNRGNVDLPTDDGEVDRLAPPRPPNREVHDRALLALDQRQRALERERPRRLPVDPDDDVPLADPGLARRAGRRRRDNEAAPGGADREADAGVRPLRVLLEARILGVREQVGVRVVEALEDLVHGRALEDVGVDPAVVGGGELGPHLVDQPEGPVGADRRRRLAGALLGLREEEAERKRSRDDRGRCEVAGGSSHRPLPGPDTGTRTCTPFRFAENDAG